MARSGFNTFIPQSTAVGLLGAGQLARMLALAAHPMGLKPYILSESPDDPAAQVTAFHNKGSADNAQTLARFLSKVEWATFESEFVNADLLFQLPKNLQQKLFPSPFCMKLLQNRATQKLALVQLGLKTSDFCAVSSSQGLNKAIRELGLPLVLKKSFGGYDGYGTFYLKTQKDIQNFLKTQSLESGWIAEQFVAFKRELAISAARNHQGEVVFLPLVETCQTQSRCDWVKGPVQHTKLGELKKHIRSFLKKINYVGVIAFELFDTGKELLINEVAPRVHNSAHYSQNALNIDQFTLHWMCGLGMRLPEVEVLGPFAMANLLGNGHSSVAIAQTISSRIHLYGKAQSKPGRKMGHLNLVGKSADEAVKKLISDRKGIRR